jgi:Polyketide cyclase / dehydrase and lipid transport
MSRAYASAIIKSPIETVWPIVRKFNGLPEWAVGIVDSKIERGLDADVVGCIRSFHTKDGTHIRERLLTLNDATYTLAYNFEKPAFPIENYIATIRLMPVTHSNATFVEWEATFDEASEDRGKYEALISRQVFAAGWKSLAAKIKREKLSNPPGAVRWKGGQPNKVWTSRVMKAPVEKIWSTMRDFSSMGDWHDDITKMHMLKRAGAAKVSGVRDFYFGSDHLNEVLLHLCDQTRSFSYRITKSELPWVNYVSGVRLWPVTAGNTTFGVWTGDWDASPQDDLALMPDTEMNVYQKAFATLESKLKKK